MAKRLLLAESFETYGFDTMFGGPARARLDVEYAISGVYIYPTNDSARSGNGSLLMGDSYGVEFIRHIFAQPETELMINASVMTDGFPFYNIKGLIIRNSDGQIMFAVVVGTDGSLRVFDKDNDECGSSYPVQSPAIFHSWEIRAKYHATNGEVEIKFNTPSDMPSIVNTSTVKMGDLPFNSCEFGRTTIDTTLTTFRIEDWIIRAEDQDFMGCQILLDTRFPNSTEAGGDWTITGAATAHEAIDEATPDDDTSYIEAVNDGDTTGVGFPDAPANITGIVGLFAKARVKTSEPGDGGVRIDCRSGATVEQGAANVLPTGYVGVKQGFLLDPNTAAPWTSAAINDIIIEYVNVAP